MVRFLGSSSAAPGLILCPSACCSVRYQMRYDSFLNLYIYVSLKSYHKFHINSPVKKIFVDSTDLIVDSLPAIFTEGFIFSHSLVQIHPLNPSNLSFKVSILSFGSASP